MSDVINFLSSNREGTVWMAGGGRKKGRRHGGGVGGRMRRGGGECRAIYTRNSVTHVLRARVEPGGYCTCNLFLFMLRPIQELVVLGKLQIALIL